MKDIYDVRFENVRELIRLMHSGIQARFAETMGWDTSSLTSRYLSDTREKRKNIGPKVAREIERRHGKPANWLDTTHRQHLLAQEPTDHNVYAGPPIRAQVPLISWVQAGTWSANIDNFQPNDAEKWLETTARVGPRAYALRVSGDSMTDPGGTRSFTEGMILIVDPDIEARPGQFVIVRQNHDTECTFKQLLRDGGRFYLKPLNPRYPILELREDAVICGVVRQATMDLD
jgi:SOS-response transcriptional repressor LexA